MGHMTAEKKPAIFILDTSAILSGKPLTLDIKRAVTTSGVSHEIQPGGRDYRTFLFLQEQGLSVHDPTKESIRKIHRAATESGDIGRLSNADIEVLALALDLNQDQQTIIITDDYSIQNVSYILGIRFEPISQSGITKRFKWNWRCSGCGKIFTTHVSTCPICGASTKQIVVKKESLERL